ncbi:MAG: hypothetical protein ACI9BC_000603 [Crocinitomicaceae bacterium]|jgi:hypothetical protein
MKALGLGTLWVITIVWVITSFDYKFDVMNRAEAGKVILNWEK